MVASQRPKGITILAWMAILGGVILLLEAAYLLSPIGGDPMILLGIGEGIAGILNLIFGFGALALKPWAWGYGVKVQVLALISHLLGFSRTSSMVGIAIGISMVGIAINIFVLYYLFRPSIKRVFGKA